MTSSEAQPPSGRPSVLTLAIASASSVVAAVLVSRIWGPGTIFGAAATPVIITLVAEMLNKPAERIPIVRVFPNRASVPERAVPPAPGAAPPDATVPAPPEQGDLAARSIHRTRRPPIVVALATGLLAFAIGAIVLTSSELIFGDSSVTEGGKRTTVFGGGAREPSATPEPGTGPTVTTQTTTETTTAPAPVPPPPTGVTPPVQTTPPVTTEPAPPPATGPTTP